MASFRSSSTASAASQRCRMCTIAPARGVPSGSTSSPGSIAVTRAAPSAARYADQPPGAAPTSTAWRTAPSVDMPQRTHASRSLKYAREISAFAASFSASAPAASTSAVGATPTRYPPSAKAAHTQRSAPCGVGTATPDAASSSASRRSSGRGKAWTRTATAAPSAPRASRSSAATAAKASASVAWRRGSGYQRCTTRATLGSARSAAKSSLGRGAWTRRTRTPLAALRAAADGEQHRERLEAEHLGEVRAQPLGVRAGALEQDVAARVRVGARAVGAPIGVRRALKHLGPRLDHLQLLHDDRELAAPHLERAAHAHRVAQLVLGVLAAQRRAVERLRAQDALDLAARRAVAQHQELERAPKPLAAQRAQRAERDRALASLAVREVRVRGARGVDRRRRRRCRCRRRHRRAVVGDVATTVVWWISDDPRGFESPKGRRNFHSFRPERGSAPRAMAAGISLLLHASVAADPRFGSVSLAAPAPAPLTSAGPGTARRRGRPTLSQQLLWPWQVAMLNGHLFSGYLRAGLPLALPGPQNIDPVRHPFGQMLPPAMLARPPPSTSAPPRCRATRSGRSTRSCARAGSAMSAASASRPTRSRRRSTGARSRRCRGAAAQTCCGASSRPASWGWAACDGADPSAVWALASNRRRIGKGETLTLRISAAAAARPSQQWVSSLLEFTPAFCDVRRLVPAQIPPRDTVPV